MTDENDFNKSHEKLVKQFSNGITHNLILWIISKENIHGYGIMKKLEEFFNFDCNQCDIKINSSKVYPILSKMEKAGLIKRTKGKEDARQRIVTLTDKGLAMQEQAKHIPECLSAEILNHIGSIEELTKIVPTLDKLIEGLKQTNKEH